MPHACLSDVSLGPHGSPQRCGSGQTSPAAALEVWLWEHRENFPLLAAKSERAVKEGTPQGLRKIQIFLLTDTSGKSGGQTSLAPRQGIHNEECFGLRSSI